MKISLKFILHSLLILVFLFGYHGVLFAGHDDSQCTPSNKGMESMERGQVVLHNDAGDALTFEVLVADDRRERAFGFQYICAEVIDRTLILFEYASVTGGQFHMRNVHAPLDIAFFRSDGKLIYQTLMLPYTDNNTPVYGPGGGFQFALEAYEGFYAAHGISENNSFLRIK